MRRELWIQRLALPLALAIAWALVSTGAGQLLVRTFFSMWLHELGHAAGAWLCGHGALPGPWRTWWSEGRQPLAILILAGGLAGLGWLGWRTGRRSLLAAALAGLAVQLACTLLPREDASALISFAGDGGGMLLGTALAAAIWSAPGGRTGHSSLRWGFLAIGAASLMDPLHAWLRAWRDPGEVPLGWVEGVGLTDASAMVERHGWSPTALSRCYLLLGLTCLAALAAGWALSVARARARLGAAGREAPAAPPPAWW